MRNGVAAGSLVVEVQQLGHHMIVNEAILECRSARSGICLGDLLVLQRFAVNRFIYLQRPRKQSAP